jgi:hypothetical protein
MSAIEPERSSTMFRFTAETAAMLEAASDRAGMSKTVYLMLALKHQFQADGLLPPDPVFAAPRCRRMIEKRRSVEAIPGETKTGQGSDRIERRKL